MKRVPMVLCLGLLLVLASISFAATPNPYQDKEAYYQAVEQARMALESGQVLTADQKAFIELEGLGNGELDRFGGPDAFGYTFIDSDEDGGPVYNWVDITETGELGTTLGDDASVGPFDIGFDFPFYGEVKTEFYVGSNGVMGFNNTGLSSLSNQLLPNTFTPNDVIAWFWDDMDPDYGNDGNWYYQYFENQEDFGECLVVQFMNWDEYPDGDAQENIDAEVIMTADGAIYLQYSRIQEGIDIASCTVGIENSDGTIGLMYTYNNAADAPYDGLAVLFEPLDPDATVNGMVTDMETGDPIEGALVTIGQGTGETDADGMYSIEGLYSGPANVSIEAFGYMPYQDAIVLETGDNVFDFELEPTAPPPPPVIDTPWDDDFENFPTVMGDQDPAWEWTTPVNQPADAHSGDYIWATYPGANYNNNDDSWLYTTSEFALSPLEASVSYWHWFYYETGWDGYNFEISTDGGVTWEILTPEGGYPDDSVWGLDGDAGFTGNGQNWAEVTYDLTAYLGQTVMFAFRHGTDGSVNNYPGVAIDDFSFWTLEPLEGTVSGMVFDTGDLTGIAGASLTFTYNGEVVGDAVTDDLGMYTAGPMWATTIDVHVEADNYYPLDTAIDVAEGENNYDFGLDCPPAIGVDPTEFNFAVDLNGTSADILNITNNGCADLVWESGIEYPEDGLAAGMDIQVRPHLETPEQKLARRELNLRDVPPLTPENGAGSTPGAELTADDITLPELDEGPYLLLSTTVVDQSIIRALNDLEIEFTHVPTAAFATVDMEGYGTVIVAMDGGTGTEEDFDAVFDFAVDGGTLMFLGGTSWTPYYNSLGRYVTHTGQQGWTQTQGTPNFEIVDDGHPLAADLPETYNFINRSASYYCVRYDDPDAEVAAMNGDGYPCLLSKELGTGLYLTFTNSMYSTYWTNPDDYALLLGIVNNMINYTSGWLSMEPTEGVVESGNTQDIDVMVDATDMLPGFYDAMIQIFSNDPNNDLVEVPVNLVVGHPGQMEGTVTDLATGDPIEGAEVIVYDANQDPWLSLFTDADGYYIFDLDAGDVDVSASACFYYGSGIETETVVEGEVAVHDFALEPQEPAAYALDPPVDVDGLNFESDWPGTDADIVTMTNVGGLPGIYDISIEYLDDEVAGFLTVPDRIVVPQEERHAFQVPETIVLPSEEALAQAPAKKAELYRLAAVAFDDLQNHRPLTMKKRTILERLGVLPPLNELDRTGGPDTFGYSFFDNNEDNGPEFEWLDISETGTLIGGMGDDGSVGPFDIGFEFPYYGSNYDGIYLGFNGSVGFDQNSVGSLSHGPIPSGTYPNNAIQFWQRDMHCNINGLTQVYTQQDNINGEDVFIIEYNNLSEYYQAGEENSVSCEIVLFESGNILLQYGFIGETVETNAMSIGIENGNGTDGLQYAYNNAADAPVAGTAIGFTMEDGWGAPWLAVDPDQGVLEVDDQVELEITADGETTGLLPGVYEAIIHIVDGNEGDCLVDADPIDVFVTYILGHPGTVDGTVMDSDTQEPIEGALVQVQDMDGNLVIEELYTDADGYYHIMLDQGDWQVKAGACNYYDSDWTDVTVVEGETTTQDLMLDAEVPAEFTVDPPEAFLEGITFEAPWRGIDTYDFSINNIGGLGSGWEIDVEYLDEVMGRVNPDEMMQRAAELRPTVGTTIYTGPASDQFTPQPSEDRLSELDDPYFLVLQDNIPWYNTHQQVLTQLEIPFDVMGSGAMGTVELDEYTVILIASTQSTAFYTNFFVTNGDRFEGWVSDGGWLEFHGATQFGNDWTIWDGTSETYQTSPTNFNVAPDHPIMEGIPESFTGTSASHNYITNLPDNADILATNDGQQPTLIEYRYGRGNMLVCTMTLEFGYQNNQGCGPIMANMIAYSAAGATGAGAWLFVDPDAGYLEVEETGDVHLEANDFVGQMGEGVWEAILHLTGVPEECNPVPEPVDLFVTFIVGPPGNLEGFVTDEATGDPLFEAEVVVEAEGFEEPVAAVLTDEDGHYTVELGTGTYSVMAHIFDYYDSDWTDVDIVEGEATLQNFGLTQVVPPHLNMPGFPGVITPEGDYQLTFVIPTPGDTDTREVTFNNDGGWVMDYEINFEYLEDEELINRLRDGWDMRTPWVVENRPAPIREYNLPPADVMANMNPRKVEYVRNVKEAFDTFFNHQPITGEQRKLLVREGAVPPLDVNELDRFGGPDAFGYQFFDSDEDNGPVFEWLDISETGTLIGGMGDDGYVGPFDMGIDFPYYGSNYDAIYLGFNGSVGFDTRSIGSLSHGPIPSGTYPNNAIQFWQRDMHCNINGLTQVYTQQDNINGENVFIIEYNNINEYYQAGEANSISCEIVLFESGNILLQYGFIGETVETNAMSIGIENGNGTAGLQYAYNNAADAPVEGTAIGFTMEDGWGTNWLSADPSEGSIEVDGIETVTFTAETAEDTPENLYNAIITVDLDYYSAEDVQIWAAMYVGSYILNPVMPTGLPYPIIIHNATWLGDDLPVGSAIGVYDGDLCVGATTVTGEWPITLISWEQVLEPEMHPGFVPGNDMSWKIWNVEAGDIADAFVGNYMEGDGTFGALPYTEIDNVNGGVEPPPVITLPLLPNYFELISLPVIPADLDAASVFNTDMLPDLAIVYQNDGDIWLPPFVNTIGDITLTQGYQLFNRAAAVLTVTGEAPGAVLDPETEYSLLPMRWNWLGYPFLNQEIPIDVALADIVDHIVIVQTDEGGIWLPPFVNTIGNMVPGHGYFAFVDDNVTFTYNTGVLASASASDVWEIPEVEGAPAATGKPYAVMVNFTDEAMSLDPATIEIYDGNLLVGKAAVLEDHEMTPVITWEGDAEFEVSGFTSNDPMQIVVKSADGTSLPMASVDQNVLTFGKGAYTSVTFDQVELPSEFAVKQGYPNPFNPSVTVPFALPKAGEVTFAVFNILGQQVHQLTRQYDAGFHSFLFDANTVGQDLVSGVYFLQVQYNGQVDTQKLMLLK